MVEETMETTFCDTKGSNKNLISCSLLKSKEFWYMPTSLQAGLLFASQGQKMGDWRRVREPACRLDAYKQLLSNVVLFFFFSEDTQNALLQDVVAIV